MSRHGAKRPDPHPARTSGPQTTFKFCPTPAFAEPAVTPDPSIVYSQTDFGTPVDISSFVEAKKQNVPDKRSMWVHVFAGPLESLLECEIAWELCECLLHASLGWLSCYMKGYMHRDVSPLNIWKIDKGPRQRHPFSTRSVHSLLSTSSDGTHTSTGETSAGCADKSTSSSNRPGSLNDRFANLKVEEDTYWNDLLKALDDQRAAPAKASDKYMRRQDIVTMAMELEEVVRDLEITTDCKAALGNFEVAAEINASYFDPEMHDEEVGANPVFMSTPLRKAMEIGLPYLQSPLDDMHSFFWTALWTVMCNKVKTSEEEWEALIMGNTDERDRAVDGILYRGTFAEDYSLLLRDMSPLLKDWQQDLLKPLNQDWAIAWKSVKDREVEEKLLVFHYFALRGILEFAKLIKKHEPRLTSTIHPTDSGTSDPQTTFGFCPIPVFADPAVTLDPSIIYSQTAFGTPVDISSIGQNAPDYRAMCTHPSVGSTKFLEDCDSAWDLCECLLHASLGWLSCYMRGYMHRDVNTLSILKIDQGPKKRAPFSTRSMHSLLSISSEAHTTTGETSAKSCADESASSSDEPGSLDNCFAQLKVEEDTYWDDLLKALDDQTTRTQLSGKQAASDKYIRQQDVAAMAKELEEIIRDLGITTECKAIISNFEIVAKIDASYFDPEMHDEEASGVPAFMSTPLRKAMEIGLPYLQSPLDDMHSFFWTALWCALGNEEMSEKEDEWETRLEGSIDERDRTMHEILHQETFEEEHGSLLRGMSPLLRDWERNLLTLNGDWEVAWKSVKDRKVEEKLLVFHCFAFRGILEVVKLVAKHKPRLTSTANTN